MLRRFTALTLRFPLSSSEKKLFESPVFVQICSCVQPSSVRRFFIRSPTLATRCSSSGGNLKPLVISPRGQSTAWAAAFQSPAVLTSCFANYSVGRDTKRRDEKEGRH